MNSPKEQDLLNAIAEINKKHGINTVYRGSSEEAPTYLSTGIPELNKLIGGGVLRGGFTEIIGIPTSGMMTLAQHLMAEAQKIGGGAIHIDLSATFDPSSARFCGVNVSELLLLRYDFETSLSALYDIIGNNFTGVVVFNTLPQLPHEQQLALAQTINRLMPKLSNTQCAFIVLTLAQKGHSPISQHTNLRLHTAFRRLLLADGEIEGYETTITVLKDQQGNEGKHVVLQITLDQKISGWET